MSLCWPVPTGCQRSGELETRLTAINDESQPLLEKGPHYSSRDRTDGNNIEYASSEDPCPSLAPPAGTPPPPLGRTHVAVVRRGTSTMGVACPRTPTGHSQRSPGPVSSSLRAPPPTVSPATTERACSRVLTLTTASRTQRWRRIPSHVSRLVCKTPQGRKRDPFACDVVCRCC